MLTADQLTRFHRHVQIDAASGCWLWTGTRNREGYGGVTVNGVFRRAHRVAYEHAVGPIPIDRQIDHLCKTTACVNPAHLEAVPGYVNNLRSSSVSSLNSRKTHCKRGHELSGYNLMVRTNGDRRCRECQRMHHRLYRRAAAEVQSL